MKKFCALLCMIACVFGLTACGGGKEPTAFEQEKMDTAVSVAEEQLIPTIQNALDSPHTAIFEEYTPEEVELDVKEVFGYDYGVDGNAFISALDSFAAAYEEMGGRGEITGSEATINGKQIIVNVMIDGPEQDAQAEIVFSNDMFLRLESASLNKVSTMGDSMVKAAMNTLLGMGSVFAVLFLISLIISCFNIIPKIQAKSEAKKQAKSEAGNGQAAVQEVSAAGNAAAAAQEAEEDDLELIAVIAAAIAASEGAASTDGFVVRSIRRRRA
ncbi:MAG: OadG family protein [Muribaculum sp.]|nr:OadG family protein [Muribaculum sp.]